MKKKKKRERERESKISIKVPTLSSLPSLINHTWAGPFSRLFLSLILPHSHLQRPTPTLHGNSFGFLLLRLAREDRGAWEFGGGVFGQSVLWKTTGIICILCSPSGCLEERYLLCPFSSTTTNFDMTIF